jgi:hypothetical protein
LATPALSGAILLHDPTGLVNEKTLLKSTAHRAATGRVGRLFPSGLLRLGVSAPGSQTSKAELDIWSRLAYNRIIKGVAEKRLRPMFQFILSEKPSLGRVAVSALYGDCDRKTKHMKGQRNRHTNTPFRVV